MNKDNSSAMREGARDNTYQQYLAEPKAPTNCATNKERKYYLFNIDDLDVYQSDQRGQRVAREG